MLGILGKITLNFSDYIVTDRITPLDIDTFNIGFEFHFRRKAFFDDGVLPDNLTLFIFSISIIACFICVFGFDINNLPVPGTVLRYPIA